MPTLLRPGDDRHRSSGRRRKRKKRRSRNEAPELIVDVVQPTSPMLLTVLGLGSILLTSIQMMYFPLTPWPWVGVASAVALIVIGLVTRTMTPPRSHPVTIPAAALLVLLPVERLVGNSSFAYAVSDPVVLSIPLVWMFPWFLRQRWSLLAGLVVWLLLFELYLTINLAGQSYIPTPVYTYNQGFAMLFYAGGWETRLMMVFTVVAAILMGVDLRGDRKKQRFWRPLRFFGYGGLIISIGALAVSLARPDWVPLNATPILVAGFGIALASRQRRIVEDPTRHPARQSTPLQGYVEEVSLAVESMANTLISGSGISLPAVRSARLDANSARIYNPYSNDTPNWVPIVTHMHTNRWEGRFSKQAMVDHYYRLGAGSVILTDHNRITEVRHPFQNIPAYEHGWGPHHHHVLVLNARKRLRERHALGSTLEKKAETLARLREVSDFLILAHPRHRNAWTSEDVRQLDYDALEVFNKSVDSFRRWDEALSADRLVWGTAGDDCHDLRSRHQTAKRFMLADLGEDAPEPGLPAPPEAVIKALKAGRFLSVHIDSREVTRELVAPRFPVPVSFRWEDEALTVKFSAPAHRIQIYGAFRTKHGELHRTDEFTYSLKPGEAYVRVVVEFAQTKMVFNPLARLAPDSPTPWEG